MATKSEINTDRDIVRTPEGAFAFEGDIPYGIVITGDITDQERKMFELPPFQKMRDEAIAYSKSPECAAYLDRVKEGKAREEALRLGTSVAAGI